MSCQQCREEYLRGYFTALGEMIALFQKAEEVKDEEHLRKPVRTRG